MPTADFFVRRGLFVVPGFFDTELCARLRAEVRPASGAQARVTGPATAMVDESVRRTKLADVSAPTTSCVAGHLLAVKPQLERHFQLPLSGCETPQFLAYKTGDFFQPHRDRNLAPEAPRYGQERQVSVVIFLNGAVNTPAPQAYGGGALAFYGLVEDPRWHAYGFPLSGEAGLLVAFRAEVFHEVTTVTHGERYTIVSWFF